MITWHPIDEPMPINTLLLIAGDDDGEPWGEVVLFENEVARDHYLMMDEQHSCHATYWQVIDLPDSYDE